MIEGLTRVIAAQWQLNVQTFRGDVWWQGQQDES